MKSYVQSMGDCGTQHGGALRSALWSLVKWAFLGVLGILVLGVAIIGLAGVILKVWGLTLVAVGLIAFLFIVGHVAFFSRKN